MKHFLLICLSLSTSLSLWAQPESLLNPDELIFSNPLQIFSKATYGIDKFRITENPISFIEGTNNTLSAGLIFKYSELNQNGLSIIDTSSTPKLLAEYGLDSLMFNYEDIHFGSPIYSNWIIRTEDHRLQKAFTIVEDISYGSITSRDTAFYITSAVDLNVFGDPNVGSQIGIGTNNPKAKLHITRANPANPGLLVENSHDVTMSVFDPIMFGGVGITSRGGEIGVEGIVDNNSETGDKWGVKGTANGGGDGKYVGVEGIAERNGFSFDPGDYYGVKGIANDNNNGDGNYYGVRGDVSGNSFGGNYYAIYGKNTQFGSSQYAGYFEGDVTVTGTFNNPSDSKLKTKISSLSSGWKKNGSSIVDNINRLHPVSYQYKTDVTGVMNLPSDLQMGFIAQELQDVFPQLVSENSHPGSKPGEENIDYLGVNYLGLIPVLTAGIQELSEENAELKLRLATLENQVSRLLKNQ